MTHKALVATVRIWHSRGMKLLSVSVVIPAYNSSRFVGGAVESALAQTHAPGEILVVDDGSTDDTVERLHKQFPDCTKLRIVRLTANRGASAARNAGIRQAQGGCVAFLDADDEWLPGKLAAQAGLLAKNPGLGAVHCDSLLMDEGGGIRTSPAAGRKQSANGNVFDEFFLANLSVILTSTALVRRACFEDVGLFDESGAVVDDHDFFLRLAWRHPIGYIPAPLVRYRVIPGSLSRQKTVRRMAQHRATLERCLARHGDYFAQHPGLLRHRWSHFNLWAGMNLFYCHAHSEARHYLSAAAPFSARACLYYLATFVPRRSIHA